MKSLHGQLVHHARHRLAWRPEPQRSPARSSARDCPRVFGRYTLLHRLATGGMAEIYLALLRGEFGFEKLVVLKCVLPFFQDEPAFIALLLDEARLAATLSHPNIVHVFDAGEIDETYYIAMEHIEGLDLRALLGRMVALGEPRPPLEHALGILTQVLAGLSYAHDKCDFEGRPLSIVHRDISPQNVLVSPRGDVKIVDFGIARSTAKLGERTMAGVLKGKASYMSPEHASGGEVDRRSDLFAAGILLFELTTGKRLFKADSDLQTLRLICHESYPRPSDVLADYPRGLESIVMKALERNPLARYQDAGEMLADLEAFANQVRSVPSRLSFARWAEAFFADTRARDVALLRAIQALGDPTADAPSPATPPDSSPPSEPTPPTESNAHSHSGMRRSRDASVFSRENAPVRRWRWRAGGGAVAVVLLVIAMISGHRHPSSWLGRGLAVVPGASPAALWLDGWLARPLERAWHSVLGGRSP